MTGVGQRNDPDAPELPGAIRRIIIIHEAKVRHREGRGLVAIDVLVHGTGGGVVAAANDPEAPAHGVGIAARCVLGAVINPPTEEIARHSASDMEPVQPPDRAAWVITRLPPLIVGLGRLGRAVIVRRVGHGAIFLDAQVAIDAGDACAIAAIHGVIRRMPHCGFAIGIRYPASLEDGAIVVAGGYVGAGDIPAIGA